MSTFFFRIAKKFFAESRKISLHSRSTLVRYAHRRASVSRKATRSEELRVNPEGWPESGGPTPAQITTTAENETAPGGYPEAGAYRGVITLYYVQYYAFLDSPLAQDSETNL
jgi:hypothetical protein